MNENATDERGKGTYVDQTEHLSHKFVTVPGRQRAATVRMGMRGLNDRSACGRLDERRCAISLHLRHDGGDALPLGPLRIDLALALDLLLLDDGGAVAGAPVDDDGSGFFTSAGAELLG